ncbi:hypothetical protein EDB62_10341 [Vibrio crassostreae]|nr:hypothetical protein EDB62_10341 [Vibrio crassostreae]
MVGTRLLILCSVYDGVLVELVEATKVLVIGDPLGMATTSAP